jgi:hypothetical protein
MATASTSVEWAAAIAATHARTRTAAEPAAAWRAPSRSVSQPLKADGANIAAMWALMTTPMSHRPPPR